MRPHKPFDTVTKDLLEADPFAWLQLVDLPGEAVRMEDANLTMLTADADRVMWVTHTPPYVANFEMQASHKDEGDRKVFRYASILHYKYCVVLSWFVARAMLLRSRVCFSRATIVRYRIVQRILNGEQVTYGLDDDEHIDILQLSLFAEEARV